LSGLTVTFRSARTFLGVGGQAINTIIEWNRRARILGACTAIAGLAACGILSADDSVELRLENTGSLRFEEVTLFTQDGPRIFSDLESGARTAYFEVSKDYGYATTHVVADGDTLILQVIDFVGAMPIEAGRYSYLLSIDGALGERFLRQELRRD